MKRISFAIIGGGPAAFYLSKLLSRLGCEPSVDIIEKQLCPFGLIRYGVAPDHISIKKSEMTLSEVASYPLFRYFGNYEVNSNGIDILRQNYSGIIYAYGASQNHVPGWMKDQNIKNNPKIKYARELVYWYNGHPEMQETKQNLKQVKNIVIIGNGNVAIDISRILLRQPSQLSKTQISKYALEELRQCNIQNIEIIGRRGVTHSAFAIKQVRELHKLGFKLYAVQEQLEESMTPASRKQCTAIGDHFNSIVRMNKRKVDFIRQNFQIIKETDLAKEKQKPGKKIIFRYLLNPKKVQQNSILFDKTSLQGQAFKQRSVPTGAQCKSDFDLLIISTGFEVSSIQEDHFDDRQKRINNSDGCVVTKKGKVDVGVYAAGWCKTGPKGVLDQTLLGCEQTLNNIRIHIQNGVIQAKPTPEQLPNHISFSKYAQVRQIELTRGNKQKFVKKKMTQHELQQFYGLSDDRHNILK